MDFWYTTSGRETLHNQPGTPNYVEGEPPEYDPKKENHSFDYTEKCLVEGFARIGYPNSGDLRKSNFGNGRLATNGYTFESLDNISNKEIKTQSSSLTKNQLLKFAEIKAGDFIFIRAVGDQDHYDMHFGLVLTIDNKRVSPLIQPRPHAYRYFHDIKNRDYYECAHRVNVEWAKESNGDFAILNVPEVGGLWRQAFGKLKPNDKQLGRLIGFIKQYYFRL